MKIAMMTNSYKPYTAGVPVSIERLTKALREAGHKVVVFAPDYNGQEEEEDIIRYRALKKGIAGGFSLPASFDKKIEKEFAAGNFDLIHVHHPMLIGSTARRLSKKYNVPLVFTYHTRYEQYLHYVKASALKKAMPFYIKRYIRQCEFVFAPTPQIEEYLNGLNTDTEIAVLPTGLPEKSYMTEKEKAAAIRKTLLQDKKYLFCTVSRLAKEKNMEFLFQALALRKERMGDDFRFAVVGEGPYEERYRGMVKKLGLSENVIFVGKVENDEVKNYCSAADAFLFASYSETQGIVLLEAMAAGTPVLALKATGVKDVVVNGINGYMCEPSPAIFLERMNEILEEKNKEKLKEGALKTAEEYQMKYIIRQAAGLYNIAVFRRRNRTVYEESPKYDILLKNRVREEVSWKHIIF